jgi:hypothetical protein
MRITMPPKEKQQQQSQPIQTPPATSTTSTTTAATSTTTTFVFLLLLILCLFPSLFHLLWTVPLHLLFPSSQPHHRPSPTPAPPSLQGTMWSQKQFTLPARARGSYLITDTVLKELPEIRSYKVGLLNLFIQHTSCALSLNENWDEVGSYSLPLCFVKESREEFLFCF